MAEQIAALRSAGLMNDEDSKVLSDGANFLRSVDHAIRLVTGKAADGLPDRAGHAEAVENLARRWGLISRRGNPGAEPATKRGGACAMSTVKAVWKQSPHSPRNRAWKAEPCDDKFIGC